MDNKAKDRERLVEIIRKSRLYQYALYETEDAFDEITSLVSEILQEYVRKDSVELDWEEIGRTIARNYKPKVDKFELDGIPKVMVQPNIDELAHAIATNKGVIKWLN